MRDISARELKGHNILAVERFQDSTRWMIEFWLLHKGLSPTSVLRHHANIHTALEKAVALGLIEANPARQASKPRRADFLPQPYSTEEASQLLNLLHGQTLELPVALALVFGLRRSEVL